MGENLSLPGISLFQIRLYYLFVFLSFIHLLVKFRNIRLSLFIILLFYNGLFSFISKDFQNIFKIILTIISCYYLINTKLLSTFKQTKFVLLSFIIFSISFFYSSFVNGDYFLITFSQYSRYFVLFSLFVILYANRDEEDLKHNLENVLFQVLLIQIVLSVIKYMIMGSVESIVGSIGSQGGAIATSLPVLAFMFLWIKKNGRFHSKEWWVIVGFMFIGFASLKRAIWFVMPVIVLLFMFYIPKRRIPLNTLLLSFVLAPLIFYIGVRFDRSLNKEGIIGGSFDPRYAFNYAKTYMFGTEGSEKSGTGRGGATILLFNKYKENDLTQKDWVGFGLRFIYATNYDEFQDLNFGISTKGAATGIFQSYVSGGFLGIIAIILFAISILIKTKSKRLKYVLITFFFWEYLFYTGIIIREYALSFLLIYIILFSKNELEKISNQPNTS